MMRVASGSITSTLQSPSFTFPSISSCVIIQAHVSPAEITRVLEVCARAHAASYERG